jgi:hypothetical protein
MKSPGVILGTIMTVAALFHTWSWASGDAPQLRVQAKVKQGSLERIVLVFSVQNLGDKDIKLYFADLPWGIQSTLILVPVTNDAAAERIPESRFIDDPGPNTVSIAPKEVLTGSINLLDRFPTLARKLKEHAVIVFWSYRPSLGDEDIPQVSGSVILRKGAF